MTPDTRRHADAERLSRWVREHGRSVFGFLVSLTGDRHLAEDLTQEVFVRAWEARERYDDVGRERGYLLRIADRLACDAGRRKRGQRSDGTPRSREIGVDDDTWQVIEPHDERLPPEVCATQLESERELHAAMQSLSEPQRRTLLLRFFGQLEFHDIAVTLGCPLNTALSHARRGLEALRKLLSPLS